MSISPIIVGLIIVLYAAIVGLMIIAFGQILLAIREIAFNTRKEGVTHPHYEVLLIMAKVNNILGWIILILGVIGGIYMAVAGPAIPLTGTITRATTL